MKIAPSIAGLIFSVMGAVAYGQTLCPAIDCDCAAMPDEKWQGICLAHERAIKQECVTHNDTPQNYCRLHGPLGKPIAVSTKASELPELKSLSSDDIKSKEKMAQTSQWSIQQDFVTATEYQKEGSIKKAYQISNILESNAQRLFLLQREAVHGWATSENVNRARELAQKYSTQWGEFSKSLEEFSDALLTHANQTDDELSSQQYQKMGFKVARFAATVLEYSAFVQVEADMQKEVAGVWQQAASVSEQLVNRAVAVGLDDKYVKYYREQASARWHRATYHWLLSQQEQESQVSFQNAGQVLLNLPNAGVAEANDGQLEVNTQ